MISTHQLLRVDCFERHATTSSGRKKIRSVCAVVTWKCKVASSTYVRVYVEIVKCLFRYRRK